MMRMDSDDVPDEGPRDAPPSGSDAGGVRASLHRGMASAKRALANALFNFALAVPDKSGGRSVDVGHLDETMASYDDDGGAEPEAASDDSGSRSGDDEAGGSRGGGSGGGGDGSPERAAASERMPLRRFGTLKRLEDDEEWAAVVEPPPEAALLPEELAPAPASGSSSRSRTPPPTPPPSLASDSRSSASAASVAAAVAAAAASGPAPPRGAIPHSSSAARLPPGALNLSRLRGGPATAWEPPVFGEDICKQDYTTVASDGWTLHMVHTFDRGAPEAARGRHPVLLCPGLASSGVGTFDLMPEVSIVDYLASKGWDVWCVCLRGNGASDKQSKIDTNSWTIDDHLFQDVPAVLAFVLAKTGATQVHWIGHSMGGMLGCGLLSQGDSSKYSEALRSLTLYGSGCFGDGSWHSLLKRIVLPVTKLGFPADLACTGMSLLTDKPAALSVFETLFYWFPNVDKHVRKRLLQSCFNYIPTTLTGQFLDSHDGPHGLTNVRHDFKYADPDVLSDTAVPVLAINGDWDLFCPAAGGRKTVELFGGAKKALTIGTAHGHSSHYGHFDVIVGKKAQEEVWPHVLRFLEENDG